MSSTSYAISNELQSCLRAALRAAQQPEEEEEAEKKKAKKRRAEEEVRVFAVPAPVPLPLHVPVYQYMCLYMNMYMQLSHCAQGDIDIVGTDRGGLDSSDDEEDLFFLPVIPDPDPPEERTQPVPQEGLDLGFVIPDGKFLENVDELLEKAEREKRAVAQAGEPAPAPNGHAADWPTSAPQPGNS